MNNIVKLCTSSICQSLNRHNLQIRQIFTSPSLQYKTIKRRKRYPFFWLQDKYHAYYDENLSPENEQFFQQFLKEKFPLNNASPLKTEPWDTKEAFTGDTARTGLIAKKLGTVPMWTDQGVRIFTTCLMVSDNHVIKYHAPEEYARIARPVDRKRYEGKGCIVIGADSTDPRAFTSEYNGLFKESGVMPKKKLTRFIVTHNSRIEPGTPLVASHFRPGMFVDVYGKSVEHGLQGLRMRYKMRLGVKTHGATKNHNRVGSIGRGRKWCGPLKGRRMPGYGVPGPAGAYVNVMDSRMPGKTLAVDNPPPFPTTSLEENSKLDREMFDAQLHKPSDPSIIFEVTEEERKAAALAARRIGKAKTAQKIR